MLRCSSSSSHRDADVSARWGGGGGVVVVGVANDDDDDNGGGGDDDDADMTRETGEHGCRGFSVAPPPPVPGRVGDLEGTADGGECACKL